jgi:hypothetical protein
MKLGYTIVYGQDLAAKFGFCEAAFGFAPSQEAGLVELHSPVGSA